jgi:hypothetical protein
MTRRSVGMFCFERYDSRFRRRCCSSRRRCYRRRTARLIDARAGVVGRARGIGVVKSFASPAVRLVVCVCVCFVLFLVVCVRLVRTRHGEDARDVLL